MRTVFKNHFIPHAGNNYQPHILHLKRTVFYSALFLIMKAALVLVVLLAPVEAYVASDRLAVEGQRLMALINSWRSARGLPALLTSPALMASAGERTRDMARYNYFSHDGPYVHGLPYFLAKAHYPFLVAGENLAVGFASAGQILAAWENSPAHRANLADPEYAEVGIGLETGETSAGPATYVAIHLATPLIASSTPSSSLYSAVNLSSDTSDFVRGRKITLATGGETARPGQIEIDYQASKVFWIVDDDGITRLVGRVYSRAPLTSARLSWQGNEAVLKPLARSGWYGGETVVADITPQMTQTLVPPSVVLGAVDGTTVAVPIPWYQPPYAALTFGQKYQLARSESSLFGALFAFARGTYGAFLVFFSLALGTSIFIKLRHQHFPSIARTLLLISLLYILWAA